MNRNDELRRTDMDRAVSDDARQHAAQPEEQVLEIRESIELTRADMSETIDELQARLSPSYLKEQVKEQVAEQYRQAKQMVREATIGKVEDMVGRVSDTVYETRRTIGETVKANPIPSALVGIGLAWLWMNRRGDSRSSAYRDSRTSAYRDSDMYRDRYADRYRNVPGYGDTPERYATAGDSFGQSEPADVSGRTAGAISNLGSKAADAVSGVAGQVQDAARNLAGKARQTASGVVDQAQSAASSFANQAQHQARRVEDRFNDTLRESPLALGAVALALGTAVGLAVPQTRKENEWMGEARDTLVDKASSVAQDTMQQVQHVAQKVTQEIGSTRADASRDQPTGAF